MIFTFDPPDVARWGTNSGCTIVANPTAPSQPNSLHVVLGGLTAAAFTDIVTTDGLIVGEDYRVFVRINFDGDSSGSANVRFSYNNNPSQFEANVQKIFDPELGYQPLGWEVREIGTWHHTFANRTFRINADFLFPSLATVEVDAIYIGKVPYDWAADMARKWAAIDAANACIRGINGSTDGYNIDFDERVYSRLFTPLEKPETLLPYVCLPLDQEAERIDYEGEAFTSTWNLHGYAYFSDNPETDPLMSQGAEDAAKFRDDLIRAFMEDQTLGGQALNVMVTAVDTTAGVLEDGIAEVEFVIEFTQMASASDLEAA